MPDSPLRRQSDRRDQNPGPVECGYDDCAKRGGGRRSAASNRSPHAHGGSLLPAPRPTSSTQDHTYIYIGATFCAETAHPPSSRVILDDTVALGSHRLRAHLALQRLLAEQGACVWPEIEARLAEPASTQRPIHPHLLSAAKKSLLRRGLIVESAPTRTRGGRDIVVYHAPIRVGDFRRIEDIAARKRLLHTRFLSWAKASKKHPRGLVGPAAERVLYASLRSPDVAGLFSLANAGGGDVTHLFGQPVPGGPLDAAAVHMGSLGGVPVGPITVLFEVKNVRHWIYPASEEPYQLLYKAARLQKEHPSDRILPVLVCRRRHYWTRQLALNLSEPPPKSVRFSSS